MSDKRKVHMLRRFGQTVTLCETGAHFRGKRPQPPRVENDPASVTCEACKRRIARGLT